MGEGRLRGDQKREGDMIREMPACWEKVRLCTEEFSYANGDRGSELQLKAFN